MNRSEAIRETANRQEVRLKKSISGKKYYSDPENRSKLSECMKKAYQEHPEYGKNRSEKLKKYYSDPENRLKHKIELDKFRSSTEYRKRVSESSKRAWDNKTPEEREKVIAKYAELNRREEVREKLSIAIRKRTLQNKDVYPVKNSSMSRRAAQSRAKRHKFYGYRDRFYKLSNQINYDYIDQYISDAEIFIKYFSAIK